jgi:hypothetical protein
VGRHAVTARSQVSLLLARSLVVWVALFDSDMSIRLQFFFWVLVTLITEV